MVKIKKGDLIELDFVGRIKETGEVFDLTIESIAKKENLKGPKDFKYEPMKAFVGTGQLLKGIDKKLIGLEVGQEKEFDLKPEEAFGKRNPKLIQLVSANKLKKHKLNPVVGMQLNVDGRVAVVRSVTSGRVILDFNHPFSGKEVHYWLKPVKVISDIKKKVSKAMELIGFNADNLTVKEGKVKLKLANKDKLGDKFLELLKKQIKSMVPEVKSISIS
ncbi:MAG: peptidylprolyl isomerase [uncultured DHVE6 group euryarchaeote]|jgi:FKBP-type peptidyl-prolyl cis-trans isomerase SlyD|nr:MAG: peptidylprolyl isomerase [uncultured DHVE6 group euryarchaeote]